MQRLYGTLATSILLTTSLAAQSTDWVQLSPPSSPDARQNTALVFDTARGVSVLFGGWDGSQRRNDTWEWNGAIWNPINTANAPSPRDGHAMAYDVLRQVMVCTAGYVGGSETWEYDGTDWTQVVTPNTHGMGPHRPMTYDLARGVIVLYGQSTTSGLYETWEYDGVDWSQAGVGSGPQSNGNLAYDLIRLRTVHFGTTGQTWEYDGAAWTQMSPINSPPGAGCGTDNMVYDLARQVVVLYGGCPASTDTWEYDGIDWTQITTANVPSSSLRYPSMTFDLNRARTVLFGGRDTSLVSPSVVGNTWEYGLSGTLAANTTIGSGCGGLTVSGSTRPVTNSNWNVELTGIPGGSIIGAILFGTSNPNLAFGALAPGCTQYSDAVFAALVPLPAASPAFGLAIPNNPVLVGLNLYAQGVTLTPGANPLGVYFSGGLQGTIGDI